jgi:hypothetical protein
MKRNHYFFIIISMICIAAGQNYRWPTVGSKALSSNFGEFRDGGFHMGIDIKTLGETGWPVYAIDDGHISRMVANFSGYGKALSIQQYMRIWKSLHFAKNPSFLPYNP